MQGVKGTNVVNFGAYLVSQAAEYGEKYDQNLVYLSQICLLVAELLASEEVQPAEKRASFVEASEKLIKILQDKGSEVLISDVDLIRRYNKKSSENATMTQE